MAKLAEQKIELPLWFEISVHNADKKSLDPKTVQGRLQQPFGAHGLVLTNAPLFVQKSHVLPNSTFVVGADTILRIDDIRFYHGSEDRDASIAQLSQNGSRFLVFGRQLDGRFVAAQESLKPDLCELCEFVTRAEFDLPISSTEIRLQR